MSSLPRVWLSPASGASLWPGDGTYNQVPYEQLPPIDTSKHGGSFEWLVETQGDGMMYGIDPEPPNEKQLRGEIDALVKLANDEGLTVPPAFVKLLSNPSLVGRITTCTSCYIELPVRLTAIEGQPGRFLRFMNDQQCVVVWGVHLLPGGGHQVALARPIFDDSVDGKTLEDIATFADHAVCADDFETFMHRFALENAIWYAATGKRAFTPEQAAYVAQAQKATLNAMN